ncbi:MAG: hypothetical protein ACXVCO_01580 [Ktedonobacterales bacterium]
MRREHVYFVDTAAAARYAGPGDPGRSIVVRRAANMIRTISRVDDVSIQTQPPETSVATTERAVRSRPPLLLDIYRGAVHGDYSRHLGVAGYLTQAVCSFIPIFGQLCAVRDLIADLAKRDRLGALLNFLALVPVVGGFPKTLRILGETMRLMSNVHDSLRTS